MGNKISSTPKKDRNEDNLKKEIAEKNREISKLNARIYDTAKDSNGNPITENFAGNVPYNFVKDAATNPAINNDGTGLLAAANSYGGYADSGYDKVVELDGMYNDLRESPQGDYAVLFTTVKKENEQIDKQIKELSDSYSTDNQKANYQSEKILTLKRINYVLFILYYMALLILTLVLFMYNTTMTKQKKVIIIITLMIFPFISDILYQILEYIYKFTYATLNGNAYTANNYSRK